MAWVAGDQLQGGKYTIERELGRGRLVWAEAVAWTGAWSWSLTVAEAVGVTVVGTVVVTLVVAGTVAGGVSMAVVVAAGMAGENLRKSFSKIHTFLILASISSLGLGLGWLGHKILNTGT